MIKNYFKFCIVRNPYNRCYSAYKDLFLGAKNKHALKSSYGVWVNKYNKPSSLSEYCKMLKKVSSNTPSVYNIHIIPQYMYIYNKNKIRMDYIGHYETMDKDIKYIYEKFKIQKEVWFNNSKTYNIKVDNLKKSYIDQFSNIDIHEINSTYFADFILLDYPIIIPHLKIQLNENKKLNDYIIKLNIYFKNIILKSLKTNKSITNKSITNTILINIKNKKILMKQHNALIESIIHDMINSYSISNKIIHLDKEMISENKNKMILYIYYACLFNKNI